ncbi:MAG: D-alanyl-D-alanine carboxypeptidase [Clostridia bacterium]|nr:D-alanyl-D-alanine carboxypeptidase [Clostridia bacterium]
MKKCFILLWCLSIALFPMVSLAEEEDETIAAGAGGAKAAILIERETGTILYEKNSAAPLPMASTTKVMTALMVLEYGHLDEKVTCSANAFGVPGTSIYLEMGETLTLKEMLYGLMLASGNDAAVAIAEHISGSAEAFCQQMTRRAKELGCENTRFATPHGLPHEDHYTTARDLAQIARAAMEYPLFREIVSTQRATIPWQGRSYDRVLQNKNKLLSTYQGATGIKTGYTKAAGRCLVFGAEREGMEVIGVVLGCPDWFNEAARIMDHGFANYEFLTLFNAGESLRTLAVAESETPQVNAVLTEDLFAVLPKEGWPQIEIDLPDSLSPGIEAGQPLGEVRLTYEGQVIARQSLTADRDAPARSFRTWFNKCAANWFAAGQ